MAIRYVCALRNKEAGGGLVNELYYTDPAKADRFTLQWRKPGIGVYDCIGALQDGAKRRCKETVAELDRIVSDLDLKNISQPRDEVLRVLKSLLLEPSEIRDSGHGLHVVWLLKEPVTDEAGLLQAEELMQQIAALLAGDPTPTHRAALLRRPGSLNTKGGGANPVSVISNSGKFYDISEFADMLDLYGQPLLTLKPKGSGHAGNGFDHTAEYDIGTKPPVDVEARLAAITYQGAGNSAIHATWKDCLGSLLRHDTHMQEAIEQILAATEARCQDDPAKRLWAKSLLEMASWYLTTFPEFLCTLDSELQETWHEKQGEGRRPAIIYKRTARGNFLEVRSWGARQEQEHQNPGTKQRTKTISGAEEEKPKDAGKASAKPFVLVPFKPFDLSQLPSRQFLYGKHYQRRTVSATIAPGGTGKSSLDQTEAVAMSTARNLLGEQPTERLRVWYHGGEDDLEEIKRRIGAICLHYSIPHEELDGWLFITSGAEVPLRVAQGYGNLLIDERLRKRIAEVVGDNHIDVAILDPLVTLHGVPEGDNMKMYSVISIFAGIAAFCHSCFDLTHHTRKGPASGDPYEYTVDDMRGASSIKDAVRAARMLNHMSQQDADAAGVPIFARTSHFRVDRVKGNNSAPARNATWRKFLNVDLPNGDEVGVVTPWEFPGQGGAPSPERAEAEGRAERVFLQLLDRFTAEHINVSSRSGPNYAPAKFAPEKEAKTAGVTKAALVSAMGRLIAAKRIALKEYAGRADRASYRLERTDDLL